MMHRAVKTEKSMQCWAELECSDIVTVVIIIASAQDELKMQYK